MHGSHIVFNSQNLIRCPFGITDNWANIKSHMFHKWWKYARTLGDFFIAICYLLEKRTAQEELITLTGWFKHSIDYVDTYMIYARYNKIRSCYKYDSSSFNVMVSVFHCYDRNNFMEEGRIHVGSLHEMVQSVISGLCWVLAVMRQNVKTRTCNPWLLTSSALLKQIEQDRRRRPRTR